LNNATPNNQHPSSKIAIIPARGGSKRIPRKNIKDFLGKPIIAYSIQAAIESQLFDEVMVSTEDNEIAEISKKFGASVPFLRSKKTSDDFATTADVLLEVINEYKKLGKEFDYLCCIYPTAPFVTANKLKDSFAQVQKTNTHSLITVVKFSYPVQRSLKIKNERLIFAWPENVLKRSQDLEPFYYDAGQFYWVKTSVFLSQKKLLTNNSVAFEISDLESQDIDNETDWMIAEIKYSLIKDRLKAPK
jgi:pseudaminic acid cytidylyltransferase